MAQSIDKVLILRKDSPIGKRGDRFTLDLNAMEVVNSLGHRVSMKFFPEINDKWFIEFQDPKRFVFGGLVITVDGNTCSANGNEIDLEKLCYEIGVVKSLSSFKMSTIKVVGKTVLLSDIEKVIEYKNLINDTTTP